jgi:hypothetical protein
MPSFRSKASNLQFVVARKISSGGNPSNSRTIPDFSLRNLRDHFCDMGRKVPNDLGTEIEKSRGEIAQLQDRIRELWPNVMHASFRIFLEQTLPSEKTVDFA